MPRRYETGSGEPEYPTSPYAYYKAVYYEVLDVIIKCTENGFDQLGYTVYRHLQDLLMKASSREDYQSEYEFVCKFYGADFPLLKTQLQSFGVLFPGECMPALM